MKIVTEQDYKDALINLERLLKSNPHIEPGSPDGYKLETLIDSLLKYETEKEGW